MLVVVLCNCVYMRHGPDGEVTMSTCDMVYHTELDVEAATDDDAAAHHEATAHNPQVANGTATQPHGPAGTISCSELRWSERDGGWTADASSSSGHLTMSAQRTATAQVSSVRFPAAVDGVVEILLGG